VSDWFTPQNYAGESTVDTCLYRNNSNGTKDFRTFSLYEYTFTLDQTKTVKSITLPHNSNIKNAGDDAGEHAGVGITGGVLQSPGDVYGRNEFYQSGDGWD